MRLPTNEEELIELIKNNLFITHGFSYIVITTVNEEERLPLPNTTVHVNLGEISHIEENEPLVEEVITVELTFRKTLSK